MKIPKMGLKIMASIELRGQTVTNKTISVDTGIPIDRLKDRIDYYVKQGILIIPESRRHGGGQIKLTKKGNDWLLAWRQRIAFKAEHGRAPPKPKRDNPDTKQRKCLGPDCGREFKSEWAGQRICGQCKSTLTWRGSQCEDYRIAHP